ncbi:MAG: hypothetical protein JXB05_20775 [Myxococcaceae bacterium]|nr:hypothetical protein [Myxococcaceae bacterium]
MRRLFLILVLASGLGCGKRQKTEAAADASAPVRPESSSSVEMPKPAPGLGGILVPPETPGASRVALEGCLAQAERTEEAGARFPATPVTRGPAKPSVSVSRLGRGILVVHELDHGCCLQAEVTSKLEGRTVTVTEVLSGESCRCRCHSRVRAAVGLPPGEYTLKVVTDDHGHLINAYEAPLSVR